mmetsp:Transcript_20027/g.46059  ORF Transcript_20027/g.46059 Transcript_20027/m.46059 type:complete len:103 (-) Transcript_20027:99-407(-)
MAHSWAAMCVMDVRMNRVRNMAPMPGETWASSFYIPSIFPLAGETSCMDTRDLMSGLTSMKQGFTERILASGATLGASRSGNTGTSLQAPNVERFFQAFCTV